MFLETPLVGVSEMAITCTRFNLQHDEFSPGENIFNGDMIYPRPEAPLTSNENILLQGWGCGLFSLAIVTGLMQVEGVNSMSNLVDRYIELGGELNEGADEELQPKILSSFGLASVVVTLDNSSEDLIPFIADGCLFISSGWENELDRLRNQSGGTHWSVISGVDKFGNVLIADPSFRVDGNCYGMLAMTKNGYLRTAHSCSELRMNPSETVIYPGANWWHKSGVLVAPKSMSQSGLAEKINRTGGVQIYNSVV